VKTAAGFAIAALCAVSLSARQAAQPVVVQSLAPEVYWTHGAGGNTGFVVARTGIIVIDTKMTADSAKATLAEIAKVSTKPITHAILTHGDADHINGLGGLPAGVTVIAHEGARRDLEAAVSAGGRGALPKDRLPSRYIAGLGEVTTIDGVKIGLHHWAPAHTNGDLAVYLPDHKLLFAGDLITADVEPVIQLAKRGSSEGWITSVKGLLGLGARQFVPAEVQARLSAAAVKRDRIAALVREGKPLDEIKAASGEPVTARGQAPLTFTDVVYQELTKYVRHP
jgi:cyclase